MSEVDFEVSELNSVIIYGDSNYDNLREHADEELIKYETEVGSQWGSPGKLSLRAEISEDFYVEVSDEDEALRVLREFMESNGIGSDLEP